MSDEVGFTSMFQEHYESVLRYAWRRVGPADAADIAAETFKVAWEKYDRVPRDQPLPWLYATARNLTLNLIRRENRRDAIADSLSEDLTRHGAEEDHAVTLAARQAALAALSSLSDGDRELVLLMSWEGLDLRQAAAVVGCSRSTAATCTAYADDYGTCSRKSHRPSRADSRHSGGASHDRRSQAAHELAPGT